MTEPAPPSRSGTGTPGAAPPPGPGSYDESYFRDVYGLDGLATFSMHWWSVRWYAQVAAGCMRRIGGRRLLEVGCGHGFTLARLEREFETWGIDISAYAVKQAARFAPRSRCAVADLEQGLPADLAPGSFDLVMAKYVFEHLRDPGRAIARLATLLRPGGLLFFAVPHTGSMGARRKGADWYAHKDPTHVSLLPPEQWLAHVATAGLVLERESSDGWWDVPYVHGIPALLQLPFVIPPTALSCLLGRAILPPRWGENILVFARKPLP
jgi:SAM-dependent methyltransferase